jgi:hypothetical protein
MISDRQVETKQQVIDDVCNTLKVGPFPVGKGSTEPAQFFQEVAHSLGIDVNGASSKPVIARRIVEWAGLVWGPECDSRGTDSGGGSTVTLEGLRLVRSAVEKLRSLPLSIDVRPGVESLLTYRRHGYETWYAIAELVDNSVASFRLKKKSGEIAPDETLTVTVDFDREKNSVIVEDNAGGIDLRRLEGALIAGREPEDKSDLNQFGMGLKTAGFWFGSRISVLTWPANQGMRIEVVVDLQKVISNNESVIPQVTPDQDDRHGTRIELDHLWPERTLPVRKTLGKVRSYLASIYRKDIREGVLSLSVDGKVLEAPQHAVLEAPRWDSPLGDSLRWEKLVRINLGEREIHGIVWLLEKGDTANAGLVLSWKGKAIVGAGAGADDSNDSYRPKAVFGSPNSFVSQRLMGELDMSEFPVTATKDGLEWTEEEQEAFAELLRRSLDEEPLPMLKMAKMFRKGNKPADVSRDIDEAAISLIAALADVHEKSEIDFDYSQLPHDADFAPSVDTSISDELNRDHSSVVSFVAEETSLRTFDLPQFIPGMREARLNILWDPHDSRVIWHQRESSGVLLICVNRGSRFLENYSALPKFHLEPILRLLVSLVVAELKATAEGVKSARRMTSIVNDLLGQSLGLPTLVEEGEHE